MRIGVTGGAGFVGSNLVRRLLDSGHSVSVIDDFSTGLRSNLVGLDVSLFEGSFVDRQLTESFVDSVDRVVHLGARGSVPRSIKNPRATHEVNVTGTLEILEAARVNGKPVIFSSSSSVYGRNPALPKQEEQWTGPLTPYAASKLAGEALAQAYGATFGFNVLTLRFFNVFGPWQRPDHDYAAVLPKWIWAAMNDKAIECHGDGKQTRDFTFVETPLDVILSAIENDIAYPGPVNLAYGNRVSLNEVIELLYEYFPKLRINHVSDRPGDVKNSQNDPTLLKELFPNVVPVPFDIALKRTIEWLSTEAHHITNGPPVED